ncbi:sulfite exporter TauE/SafE family protein [Segetibacter sp. 3557_3]|uniref:sulfite exporter TauE/SafE family protein n=1 Tax=Segetibacter sp. 3557_3 TaxID=2547429 RepID=UPI00105865D7|nr:TSUP family transporter [Segetibacter sp. 3557_3]TDH28986.1 sulfite exporter TauE/SafE family protein [Segetibacter sp. 3557_3]
MSNEVIAWLCLAAFAAGFIDAVVGGGGLIQTPAGLVLLPQFPVATVIGSLKIPAFCGTFLASLQYIRRVKMDWPMLTLMTLLSCSAAFTGSYLLSQVHNDFMKPLLLIILIFVALYTYSKKNFGIHSEKDHDKQTRVIYSVCISIVIGFYDGFIGPGAGSFLVLAFITLLGFDFLKASAHAKMVNLATNMGSILFFAGSGRIILAVALPMAVCNAIGGILGARLAIQKGNKFIRVFFLLVVTGTIVRFAYDVFFKR